MAKIEIGDTVYILKEFQDWVLYQIAGTVIEIRTVPKYGIGHLKLYMVQLKDGSHRGSYFNDWLGSKERRAIRKTPYPKLPLFETQEEIAAASEEHG